jgi:hypothetical protein
MPGVTARQDWSELICRDANAAAPKLRMLLASALDREFRESRPSFSTHMQWFAQPTVRASACECERFWFPASAVLGPLCVAKKTAQKDDRRARCIRSGCYFGRRAEPTAYLKMEGTGLVGGGLPRVDKDRASNFSMRPGRSIAVGEVVTPESPKAFSGLLTLARAL